jgi:hypothetical protein
MSTVSQPKPKLNRAEAARLNGAKSKGPITEEGKQISTKNRLSHGFYTEKILLSEDEEPRFFALCEAFHNAYGPLDDAEVVGVRRALYWAIF